MFVQQCVHGYAHPDAAPAADADAAASAEANADADALAEANADANAQYMGYPESAYNMGSRPPVSEPGCGMMDSCCGMSNEGCCMGGQQCYTYYERECENTNEPQCNMRGKTVCMNIPLKDCRVVQERRTEVRISSFK